MGHRAQVVLGIGVLGIGHRALGIGHRVLGIGHRALGIGHRVLGIGGVGHWGAGHMGCWPPGIWGVGHVGCWASGIAPPVMHRRTRESQLATDRAAQMRVKPLVLAGVVVTLLHRE